MLYQLYEWNHAALTPFRAVADATRLFYQNPLNPLSHTTAGRSFAAAAELFERTTRVYGKPEFGLHETAIRGQRVPVVDKPVWRKPFCDLLHFERELPRGHGQDPRILVVAPMSGHYATLLRGTVEALLPYADVYISDWKDARTVPLSKGSFDLDDYVDYVVEMLRFLGPDTHVIGVCQPAVPVLMATAVMEKAGDPCAPATMTLMGGPIDTRINPTAVNKLAEENGIEWFRENVVMAVPFPHAGFMRQVYPGFLQLTGFMSMNLDRHFIAHKDFFWHLVKDDGDSAEKHREFYDEYNAVMDLTAEFYLQTVEEVFIKHSLPKGDICHHGERVDLTAIRNTALLTVEGENDDISGVGQTEAAQDLCVNIPGDKRVHYVQPKVGHYGVFNGSRFRAEICPRIVDFALTHGTTHSGASAKPRAGDEVREPRRIGAYAERAAKAGTLGRSLSTSGESGFGAAAGLKSFDAAMKAITAPAKAMMSGAMDAASYPFGSFAGSNNAGFSSPRIAPMPETVQANGAADEPVANQPAAPTAEISPPIDETPQQANALTAAAPEVKAPKIEAPQAKTAVAEKQKPAKTGATATAAPPAEPSAARPAPTPAPAKAAKAAKADPFLLATKATAKPRPTATASSSASARSKPPVKKTAAPSKTASAAPAKTEAKASARAAGPDDDLFTQRDAKPAASLQPAKAEAEAEVKTAADATPTKSATAPSRRGSRTHSAPRTKKTPPAGRGRRR
ncbi:polyhydroxyalkanoate depolymerase [Jiella sp. MQZ9-1]|uniref:Polyhydroxyalkanoate depolymerase n=2 Tax=Jiella flava TaxID=2816857 RepID=A0A939JX38_9HYPH|nr:polyhydroxyalkanoate depolymerase [Jiella flava]MBO0664189.1 polyhydroxyalkanoate depolymerase [Jiella flava]MCD2472836.1 polyhydroxyalkanoate depolymerase [Jiella flava]